jgi:hypothetical protein
MTHRSSGRAIVRRLIRALGLAQGRIASAIVNASAAWVTFGTIFVDAGKA